MHHPSVPIVQGVSNSAGVLLVIFCASTIDGTEVVAQVQRDVLGLAVDAWEPNLDLTHLQQLFFTLFGDRKLAALPLGKAIVFEWLNDLFLEP